jgi:CheY-like chemotaxis protein
MTDTLEILLVEDNEGDVELVRGALQNEVPFCNLSVVNNGRQALDRVLKHGIYQDAITPHLILLDLNLSGMDGKILLKIMKQDEQLKMIPVVILTSSRAPSDILESYAYHANCYIVKPFDGKEFKSTIRQALAFWRNVAQLPFGSPQ